MASTKCTLFQARGQILQTRRGVPPSLVDRWLNAKIAEIIDRRTYWTDLTVRGVISVPNAYTAGTVSVNPQSSVVLGSNTFWPVSDIVNTTIPNGIFETGNQEVFPSSMQGIDSNSVLLVDYGGPQEIVAVNNVTPTSFWAVFAYPHNQDCTVTQSSLVNLQFRMGAESPIFDCIAIQDPQTMIISVPWGGLANSGQAYFLAGMYYPIVPNLRMFGPVVDRQQGFPIRTNRNLSNINWADPQRTASGDPTDLVDIGASRNGQSLYELWPTQLSGRQIDFTLYVDWPELVNDTDRLPWFFDPQMIVDGALSDAFAFKSGKDDWLHSMQKAEWYKERFEAKFEAAKNADESKMQMDLTSTEANLVGGGPGTLYYQQHVGSYSDGDWYSQL